MVQHIVPQNAKCANSDRLRRMSVNVRQDEFAEEEDGFG